MIRIEKSVYAPKEPSDGKRILVMTLWPRGVSKDKVDVWMNELGTPRDLIKRYKAGKVSREAFVAEYRRSLRGEEVALSALAQESKRGTITLLCTEKDPSSCHRSVLKAAIEAQAETLQLTSASTNERERVRLPSRGDKADAKD